MLEILVTLIIIVAIAPIFGAYIAQVFLGKPTFLDRFLTPIESLIYRIIRPGSQETMTGGEYIRAIFYSNLIMGIWLYFLLIFQGIFPLNPNNLAGVNWDLALHTTISFLTNTNQQHYGGETTLSYGSQVLGLGFLMFTSAGTGLAVGIAFIRGVTGRNLGNFYVDLTKSITRILLPIALIAAVLLLLSGVPETLSSPVTVTTLEGNTQIIAVGPVAHFESIKQLGENGGGFFSINSAHPLENPNGFSNLLEMVLMMLIPTSLIFTYGIFANNKKQAILIFSLVFAIFLIGVILTAIGEFQGNPLVNKLLENPAPNLEGKEVRLGWASTSLWAVMTTGTMTGAVNGMLDSFQPTGGFILLFNLFLQIVWGGQGTGTAYLFVYLILSVFLTGLMVGRTPEFLGRKIEKQEIILSSIILLIHPIGVLIPTAITLAFPDSLGGITNPNFHGLSQVVYEYASASANNGSGFEGLIDNTKWWNLSTCFSLLIGRYIPIIALILLANNLSQKKPVPLTPGTLTTDTVLFTGVTGGVILILGALTFFPILALGPIAEALEITRNL